MVQPMVLARAFDGQQIFGVADNADHPGVAPGIRADGADFIFGQVLTDFTGADAFTRLQNGVSQLFRPAFGHGQDVKRQALRAFVPNAGQPLKLLDKLFKRRCEILHGAF